MSEPFIEESFCPGCNSIQEKDCHTDNLDRKFAKCRNCGYEEKSASYYTIQILAERSETSFKEAEALIKRLGYPIRKSS